MAISKTFCNDFNRNQGVHYIFDSHFQGFQGHLDYFSPGGRLDFQGLPGGFQGKLTGDTPETHMKMAKMIFFTTCINNPNELHVL